MRQHQFWSRITRWAWLARLKRRLRQLGLLSVPNEPHPEAVVIRFTPMSPQGVLHRAELDARRSDGKGITQLRCGPTVLDQAKHENK